MDPVLLAPDQGETTTDEPERLTRIIVDQAQMAVVDFRYAPGESGPGPHIHHEHADCFYVTRGEVTFEVGPDASPIVAGPGTFVMVPPEVVHTFRNAGGEDAEFVNIHAPNCGFADRLRNGSSSNGFDTADPPEDGGRPAADVVIRGPGEGEVVELGPTRALIKAGGGDGIGSLTLLESTYAAGFEGPPPHRHREMIDSFYIRDGTLTLLLGDETVEGGPGTFALVPPRNRHTFSNCGDEPARVLNIMAPGGFEAYLVEMTELMRGSSGAPDPAELARVASKYDFELALD